MLFMTGYVKGLQNWLLCICLHSVSFSSYTFRFCAVQIDQSGLTRTSSHQVAFAAGGRTVMEAVLFLPFQSPRETL